jgi:predicted amidophosphoribosyltransferase
VNRERLLTSSIPALFDIVFPRFCLGCGDGLLETRRTWLCPRCLARIEPLGMAHCPVCAADLGAGAAVSACSSCLGLRPNFTAAVAVGKYDGLLRELVPRLKFGREGRLAWPLAELLHETLILHPRYPEIDAIVPVPLTLRRRVTRGFNQAELIAEEVARRTGLPLLRTAMRRVRRVPPQVSLSRTDRLRSPIRTMSCRDLPQALAPALRRLPEKIGELLGHRLQSPVGDRTVLLVDDVMTTGATLKEATRALLAAGAREVFVGAVARA